MIFVDSNVFIYAVGRPHPLRNEAQDFFLETSKTGKRLATSAEVLQELLHVYLPVSRLETLGAALKLTIESSTYVTQQRHSSNTTTRGHRSKNAV